MRDFLPDVARRRNGCIDALRRVFESFGFEPLDTPAVEPLEVLMGKYGAEADKLVFEIAGRGDDASAQSALRYDLTVPLARVVAMHQAELTLPWKRWQIAPVWRAERPQRGRFREFLQCDIDVVGAPAPVADAEVAACAVAAYRALGFGDVVLRVNHRGVVRALCETLGIDGAAAGFLLRTIDKEDRIGLEGVCEALAAGGEGVTLPAGAVPLVRGLFAARDAADVPAALEALVGRAPSAGTALTELRQLWQYVSGSGVVPNARLDPALMRGLDYYTGPVFEAVIPAGGIGSVGGGGRYDGLVGSMLGRDIPAVGFSVGLERLLVLLAERESAAGGAPPSAADVLVATFSHDLVAASLALAAELRAGGLRVEVFPGPPGRLAKQYTYADKRRIPLVALVGSDELAAGVVAVKDMAKREEARVARAEVSGHLRTRLGG
jgi:histidyl-tRNA synthetase